MVLDNPHPILKLVVAFDEHHDFSKLVCIEMLVLFYVQLNKTLLAMLFDKVDKL